MKKPIILVALLTFSLIQVLFSQSTKEFKESHPDSDAIILFNMETVNLVDKGGSIDIKIKVVEKQAILVNRLSIQYWPESVYYNSFETLENLKGETRNPRDHKESADAIISDPQSMIDKSDLYSDSKKRDVWFPKAKEGMHTTLRYERIVKDPHFLRPFYFLDEYPSISSSLHIKCDTNIEIGWKYHGPDHYQFKYQRILVGDQYKYSWSMDSVPEFIQESGGPNFQELSPKIIFYIKSVTRKGVKEPILDSVSDLHRWYRSLVSQTNYKTNTSIYKLAKEITDSCTTDDEKIRGVFQWVQNNIKYINTSAGLGGFIPDDCVDVLKNRYGDCKAMTNLTKELLRIAEVESYYCWVGTDDLPYTYAENFTPSTDNHMILAIGTEGNFKLLDATNSYGELYKIPYYLHGKETMISLGDSSFIIYKIPMSNHLDNTVSDSNYLFIEDEKLKGKAFIELTGSLKNTTEAGFPINDEEIEEYIRDHFYRANKKTILSNISYSGLKDRTNIMKLSFDYELSDYQANGNGKKYINLHMEKPLVRDQVDIEKRKSDLLFNFPIIDKFSVVFEIPIGYQIISIPENKSSYFDNFEMTVDYVQKEGEVILNRQIIRKSNRVKTDEFNDWNLFLSELKKAYSDVLVLQKI
ncbi:MAG: hypothetical protein GQ527_06250 [Bacteroidales bacterium]|nr:hypothetical protein [Bacteroidales bacterium]